MSTKSKSSTQDPSTDVEQQLSKYSAPPVVGEATDPFSFITLSWLSKMVWVGYKRPLQFTDLPLIPEKSKSDAVAHIMDPFYAKLKVYLKDKSAFKKPPSYFGDIWRAVWLPYVFSVFLDAAATVLRTTQPAVMAAIIKYLASGNSDFFIKDPYGLAIFYFMMSFLSLVFQQAVMQMFRKMRYNIRSTIMTAIYAKSLKLSNASATEFTKGRILQMVNVDVPTLAEAVHSTHQILLVPFQLAFSFYYLSTLFGSGLYPVGIVAGVFLLMAPGLMFLIITSQEKYMKSGDVRLARLREILEGMKMIKMRGQESYFTKVLSDVRQTQLKAVFGMLVGLFGFVFMVLVVPYGMMIGTFMVYASRVSVLDPAVLFPATTYFFNIFEPMQALPMIVAGISSALVSWNRIRKFMLADESEFVTLPPSDSTKGEAISVVNGTFRWEAVKKEGEDEKEKEKEKAKKQEDKKADKKAKKGGKKQVDAPTPVEIVPLFKDLDLSIAAGKLTAIVGTVGSGKSSLLSALTGEMTCLEGKVSVYGSVALCQQQTWLMSMDVRSNILFGRELNQSRLDDVIHSCGLAVDIQQFQHGLDTEIGEKGIALSGGQKARVSLARAVYSDADIYLLDDPLAALDAHVGKHVFDELIKKSLDGKTRVLVTHQLHVLPHVDHIIVLDKGVIVEQGSYEQLAINGPETGLLKEMLKNHALEDESTKVEKTKTVVKTEKKADSVTGESEGLLKEEDRQTGAVGKKYVANYFKESGGFYMLYIIILAALLYGALSFMQNLWLTFWSDDSYGQTTRWGLRPSDYITVYTIVVAATFVFGAFMVGIIEFAAYRTSKAYHSKAVAGLFRAPMSFFDSQPLGRIINRMTKDMETLDLQIWNNMLNFFVLLALGSSNLAAVIYSTLYTLIFVFFLSFLYYYLLEMYRSNQREIRRLAALQRSPLNAYISECIGGSSTIRAFQVSARTIHHQRELMDKVVMPEWTLENVYNWFSIRLQVCLSSITLFIVLFAVGTHMSAFTVGLALNGVGSLGDLFFNSITAFSRLESDFVAAERLDLYCNDLEREAPDHLDSDPVEGTWPTEGRISIKDLEVKYSSKFDPVIKNLSVEIKGSEKIGVVGRTGSGKSTLMTALFRIVEPTKGTVLIDGVDVSRVGLNALRSRLQIIPQDPVLFTGTIRSNIDVEGKFSDQQIWEALEFVGLKDYVSELTEKLDAPVAERGENLSVGQRQLMMLASAICHRPKILIMDEASSAVDQAADLLIQSSIHTHFKETTVISIAHRINTIASFDRIMVLDAGKLVEYDSPANLLKQPESIFKSLVDATGTANAAVVTAIANHTL